MRDLRITAGQLRGRRVEVPPGVRPTEGRVREALFSIWQMRLRGARVLDLFAGSGAVGLEALGRGASLVVFVENQPRVLRVLRHNVHRAAAHLGEGEWRIFGGTVTEAAERFRTSGERFDLIFADPPYRYRAFDGLLTGAARLLAGAGELVVEHATRTSFEGPLDGPLARVNSRRYGETTLSFFALEDRPS